MIDLGTIKPGNTIRIPFGSFAAATGAPAAVTNYADADIQVYKDGSTTQRASAAGLTATTTFDTLTGVNLVTIDTSDNTTAGFWAAGSEYIVIVSDITVDGQTLRFPIARFRLGLSGSILDTTIATLSSQTSFTLTVGPAEDNALIGCLMYFHDVASAVQGGFGYCTAYTGSTKTVTLAAGPSFTIAASDNVMVLARTHVYGIGGTAQTARDLGASVLLSSGTGTGQLDFTSGVVKANLAQILGTALTETAGQIAAAFKQFFDVASPTGTMKAITNVVTTTTATNVTTVNGLAANVITAASMAADASAEIADAVWDEAIGDHLGAGSTGLALNSAGAAGDPWSTAIPGAYGAGTAGHRLGNIPDVAAGAAGGVFIAGTNAATTITTGLTTTFTGNLTGSVNSVTTDVGITQAGADKVWSTATRALTDKAGFALSSAGVQAIWDALTSALTTASSIGKLLVDNVNATISSRMATYTQPTGFLAATFPAGTIANTTNITAGTVTTATNVTTVNGLAANVITAASLAADASAEIADAVLDEVAVTYVGKPDTLRKLVWFMRKVWANKRKYDKATNHQIIYEDDGTTPMLDATMVNDASEATRGAA